MIFLEKKGLLITEAEENNNWSDALLIDLIELKNG